MLKIVEWVVARPKVSASARWQSEWCFGIGKRSERTSSLQSGASVANSISLIPTSFPLVVARLVGMSLCMLCHASLSNSRELPVICTSPQHLLESLTTSPRKSYQHISQTPTRGWTSNMDLGLSPQLVVASWKFQATSWCPRTTATGHIIQAVLPDFYHTLLKQTSQFFQLQHWLLWQCL